MIPFLESNGFYQNQMIPTIKKTTTKPLPHLQCYFTKKSRIFLKKYFKLNELFAQVTVIILKKKMPTTLKSSQPALKKKEKNIFSSIKIKSFQKLCFLSAFSVSNFFSRPLPLLPPPLYCIINIFSYVRYHSDTIFLLLNNIENHENHISPLF